MKRIAIIMALSAISITSFTQNYTLKGEVIDMLKEKLEGKMLYITNVNSGRTIDSAKVVNGAFAFSGTAKGDSLCQIAFLANHHAFILEPGNIVFDNKKMVYTGTPLNDIAASCRQKEGELNKWASDNYKKINGNTALSNDEKARHANLMMKRYNRQRDSLYYAFAHANQDNALNTLLIQAWLGNMNDDVKRFDLAWSVAGPYTKSCRPMLTQEKRMNALRKVQVDMPFVDFTVPKGNLDGTPAKLSDYVGKGKYILVDFWASWCGPCRAEIPNIKEAYNKYHGDKFDVLSIAVWDQHPRTMKALEEENMPWKQIIDADKIPTDAYGINGIPQIILFAPDGTIAARNLRGENVDRTIHKFLNQTAVITGNVPELADGEQITLLENGNFMEKETNRRLATTTVKEGKFCFNYDCDGKVRVGFISGKNFNAGLIIEPGNINITMGKGKKTFATGTLQNDRLHRYHQQSDSLKALVNKAMESVKTDDYNEYLKQAKVARAQFNQPNRQLFVNTIEENLGTAFGEYVLYNYGMSYPDDAVGYLKELDQETYSYRPLIGFAKKLLTSNEVKPGIKFRDFTVKDGNADGTQVSLSDYVGKGNVTLVDFWASWCGWCRRETPNLRAVYDKYKNKNFTIVGLAVQDKKEATLKAIKEDKPTWPQILNCGDVPMKLYGINGIPQIMLFDTDGTLLARDLRGEEIMKAVDKAMNK